MTSKSKFQFSASHHIKILSFQKLGDNKNIFAVPLVERTFNGGKGSSNYGYTG